MGMVVEEEEVSHPTFWKGGLEGWVVVVVVGIIMIMLSQFDANFHCG
jgi:hypothetical protein